MFLWSLRKMGIVITGDGCLSRWTLLMKAFSVRIQRWCLHVCTMYTDKFQK